MSGAVIYVMVLDGRTKAEVAALQAKINRGDRSEAEQLLRQGKAVRSIAVQMGGAPPGRSEIDGARERRDLGGAVELHDVTGKAGPGAAIEVGIDRPPRPRR